VSARVAGLFIHPLKSGAAVSLDTMEFDALGPIGDRRWLVITNDGEALTQRDAPALSRVRATLTRHDDMLTLRTDALHAFDAVASNSAEHVQVNIWGDVVSALDAGDAAAAWCTAALGTSCRLVRISPNAQRPLARKYAGPLDPLNRHVAFSDGSPVLLLSVASIAELNLRLPQYAETPLGRDRFRPNILIEGVAPHEEDSWFEVIIGSVRFGVGSTCPRCVITTVDQTLGERVGPEPLRTLSTYRLDEGKAMFGVNATHDDIGSINIGDSIHIVSQK
jgi:uncharacterized protein